MAAFDFRVFISSQLALGRDDADGRTVEAKRCICIRVTYFTYPAFVELGHPSLKGRVRGVKRRLRSLLDVRGRRLHIDFFECVCHFRWRRLISAHFIQVVFLAANSGSGHTSLYGL